MVTLFYRYFQMVVVGNIVFVSGMYVWYCLFPNKFSAFQNRMRRMVGLKSNTEFKQTKQAIENCNQCSQCTGCALSTKSKVTQHSLLLELTKNKKHFSQF